MCASGLGPAPHRRSTRSHLTRTLSAAADMEETKMSAGDLGMTALETLGQQTMVSAEVRNPILCISRARTRTGVNAKLIVGVDGGWIMARKSDWSRNEHRFVLFTLIPRPQAARSDRVRSSGQRVDLEALKRFVFTENLQHPMSTGRLFAFGLYGPLDAHAQLRSGWRPAPPRPRLVTLGHLYDGNYDSLACFDVCLRPQRAACCD